MIKVENLSFRYPKAETPAIDALSLRIEPGTLYGLLGPNGSGKTTLISLIMGLLKPSSGSLSLGPDTTGARAPSIAFVPQEYAFYLKLSVRENLRFFAGVSHIPGRRHKRRLDEVMEITQLAAVASTRAGHLSGGLKRRLNLAIGLLNKPDLLLLDEPTVGIDPHSRHFILKSIEAIHKSGTTVVYTSHYMEEIEALCNRIGILDHGRLLAQGSLAELLNQNLPGSGNHGVLNITLKNDVGHPVSLGNYPEAIIAEDTLSLAECPPSAVPAILAELKSRHIEFTRIRYARRNLEDLFLDLTGRQLRD